MKKYSFNIALILILSASITFFLMSKTSHVEDIAKLSLKWGFTAFSCMMLYWAFETLVQHLLMARIKRDNRLWNTFKVVMSGHFFNAITPFSSGGQPMQLFIMTKQGIPIGTSASVLLSKFIIYQMILTLYSLIVLLLQLQFFVSKMSSIIYLSLIGFIVNLIIVIVLIMAAFMRRQTTYIAVKAVELLHKMELIKKPYTIKKRLIGQIAIFNDNVKELLKNKKLLCLVSALTVLQLTAYFLIPYAVYRGFGLSGANIFVVISASAFIVMFSSFIPVPGGSGVAEGSFFILFQLFFPKSILPIAILIWRIVTFYIPLCLGGIITLLPNYPSTSKHL